MMERPLSAKRWNRLVEQILDEFVEAVNTVYDALLEDGYAPFTPDPKEAERLLRTQELQQQGAIAQAGALPPQNLPPLRRQAEALAPPQIPELTVPF